MDLTKGLFSTWQNLPEGAQNAATNVAANLITHAALSGAQDIYTATGKDIETPSKELNDIAKSFHNSLKGDKNNFLQPGDIRISVGPKATGEFVPSQHIWDKPTVKAPPKAHTLAHELGHAYNYGTTEGSRRQNAYGRGTPRAAGASLGTRIGGMAINLDPDAGPIESIVSGAAGALLDPDNIGILKEEASAWNRGRKYMNKAGVKITPRMAGNALAAFSTYPLTMLRGGVQSGITSFVASQALDKGLKGLRDITDPLLYKLKPELSPEEKALEQYGYDRDKHRIVASENLDSWEVQPRFYKRGM